MNIFTAIFTKIREAFRRMIPFKSIEQAERIESPISTEMATALDRWHRMYLDKPDWLGGESDIRSMNLPAFVCSEVARQVLLEMQWNITGKDANGETQDANGETVMNPRAEYLKAEFEKLMPVLRQKLEQACAAGGMVIKPYHVEGHIYFDFVMDWGIYPMAFDDDGKLSDVVIPDMFVEGKTYYTRLERHKISRDGTVEITQRAFKSNMRDNLGTEISLEEVERWKGVEKESKVPDSEGALFGWYKVAAANSIDVDSPMGAAVFAKAEKTIKEADIQYSRILWEYEGSELAIDVDPSALRPRVGADGKMEMPKLKERLFRAVDIDKGDRDLYEPYAPAIRDASLFHGLNQILMRVEDLCGLSRGTISDANTEARTATELKIVKQRSYATVADNQQALESCLKDVVRAMDKYATIYNLAPEGDYDVSFEWDDSILTDTEQQTQERLMLLNAGIISKAEFRQWYMGETPAQAKAAIEAIDQEKADSMASMDSMLPQLRGDNNPVQEDEEEEGEPGPKGPEPKE